jgi:hypothetical protein
MKAAWPSLMCQADGLMPSAAIRRAPPRPERDLLAQARLVVAAVQLGRDGAVLRPVLVDVGVEQVERDAAHLDAPGAQVERAGRHLQRDLERLAARVAHELECRGGAGR